MNNFKKLSQKFKKIATTMLSVCTLACTVVGTSFLIATADTTTESSFTRVAHYEFNDATNFGKDSLGNNNLINAGGVVADTVNGGVTIGDSTTKGYLYASGTRTTDFTDKMDGSYSVSVRAYLKEVSSGGNVIVSTSNAWSGKFDVRYAYTNINVVVNGTSYSVYDKLNATAAWYRITAIYDETNLTYKTIVLKEGETTATETSIPITGEIPFGDLWGLFAVGARTNGDGETKTWSENAECDGFLPSISDLRIYSGVIDNAELATIKAYDEENALKKAQKAVADNSEVVGASIRVVGEPGLRFLSTLNESVVNEYIAKYGEENVSFGMKVVRNHNGALAYAYVPAANKTLNNGVYSFNAVITGMTEEYYATEYTGMVYIAYTVNGETTYVVSEESKTRSITFVAEAALDDTYVVGTDGTLEEKPDEYKYEISEGVWSPYSTALRTTLAGYVVSEEE